jgi:CxxC-x17-CxxC domain-containing protein
MLQKRMFETKCTDCGEIAMVPFKPTAGKPVYCRTCFSKHFKRPESVNENPSFDPKQAWSRRGDGWQGRKEKPANIFK